MMVEKLTLCRNRSTYVYVFKCPKKVKYIYVVVCRCLSACLEYYTVYMLKMTRY